MVSYLFVVRAGATWPNDMLFCILIMITLKSVPKGPIDNNPALVWIMAWCRIVDKPLSEPLLSDSLTHICGTIWVNSVVCVAVKFDCSCRVGQYIIIARIDKQYLLHRCHVYCMHHIVYFFLLYHQFWWCSRCIPWYSKWLPRYHG